MSVIVAVLLSCTALTSTVVARIAYRLAAGEGASRAVSWGAAGGAALATIIDVCTVADALKIAHGTPPTSRTALIVVTVVLALVMAFVSYDLTGPKPAPAGGVADPGLSKAGRWGAAASGFTSVFIVLALILPLLK
ncbi:hypothetical protein [Streptomyces sasae]|uniref:hypothetical protein n=1 Tax=Streptomyces sasae TaxID=1266772 RepID=UPI00292F6C97|nr:hypothetical protein [Streptomyces sasae]